MKLGTTPLRAEMAVDSDSKPLTAELAAETLFGLPLPDLLRAMKENRGGKYDCIYSDAPQVKQRK